MNYLEKPLRGDGPPLATNTPLEGSAAHKVASVGVHHLRRVLR